MAAIDYLDEESGTLTGEPQGPLSPWEQEHGNVPYSGSGGEPLYGGSTTPTDSGGSQPSSPSIPSSVPKDWAEDFLRRNPGDYSRLESAYQSNNLSKRNIPGYDDTQSDAIRKFGGLFGGTNVPAQFTDPISSFLEQFAQQRAQQRENPPSGSGQNLLENALRDIAAQFKSGGFTPGEQEVFQTQALDPLERLRTARKQQVMEQLSRRGITPQSGVAISMLQDVDRQFDGLRSQTQRSIAAQGAQETQARMLQAIQLLSGLAGTENQRLNEAFQYRTVPLNLADRSFNQASQVYNMAGNPLTLAAPYMALANQQQGRSDNVMEALGYLAAIFANR